MSLKTKKSQGAIEGHRLSQNLKGKLDRGISVNDDMIFEELMKFREIKRKLRKWKSQLKLIEIKIWEQERKQNGGLEELRREKRRLKWLFKLEKQSYNFHRIKKKRVK